MSANQTLARHWLTRNILHNTILRSSNSRVLSRAVCLDLLPVPLQQKLEAKLQHVADATLTLFVNEILTVEKAAVFVLRLWYGFPLRHSHFLPIQLNADIF